MAVERDETLTDVWNKVAGLLESDAIHARRRLAIKEASFGQITNHLLEECVELQAEFHLGCDRSRIVEEAGDALAILIHLMIKVGVTEKEFADATLDKLHETFMPQAGPHF